MLQQTQVSRVLERFDAFVARFPDVGALARAGEDEVLAMWAGLGYYRRARLLHAAAKATVEEFGGEVPRTVEGLRRLPGVGRYTAGAIASICFGAPEAIVDGNVSRVLLRVHGRPLASDDPRAVSWCWARAGALARATRTPGEVNEGLMELGATVCTPRGPRCSVCPLKGVCVARRMGKEEEIPGAKRAAGRARMVQRVVVVRDGRGRVLMERRPMGGLWGGLWQPVEVERARKAAGSIGVKVPARPAARVRRTLSHRDMVIEVFDGGVLRGAEARRAERDGWRWVGVRNGKAEVGVSSAHAESVGAVG